jgi:hypothetical protein
MRKLIFTGLILFLSGTVSFARVNGEQENKSEKSPSPVVFKFVVRDDMFYIPWSGNGEELKRLYDFVEQHKAEIADGRIPICVDSYCTSFTERSANRKTASIRANRVKSELITHKGLKEENFITRVHSAAFEGRKNVVVVSFALPDAVQPSQEQQAQPRPEPKPAQPVVVPDPQPAEEQPQETEQPIDAEAKYFSPLQIRTNLLLWAVATPNLGVEWRPSSSLGLLVNGVYSHWIWSDNDKHHRTWLVQPEIRWYPGASKQWFIGLEGHLAQFNLKFSGTGYQGDAVGGGFTGGYRLQLSKYFDMDFSLGLGYTQLRYDTYYRSNGVMVRKESNLKKNVFAPTQLGASFIWKLK